MKKIIYLDHAATTPLDPEVLDVMQPFFRENFANASSIHQKGVLARRKLEEAREQVAEIFNCLPKEIIFTSGPTENDDLFLRGVSEVIGKGKILTSRIEHHSVLDTIKYLGNKKGFLATKLFQVGFLPVDKYGKLKLDILEEELNRKTIIFSLMYANNEIGTIQDIRKISELIKKKSPSTYFYVDAVQAAGVLSLDVKKLGVDGMSIGGHKFYGPKGSGVLFLKKGIDIQPQVIGGGQERGLRGSTENVPGIIGLAFALKKAYKNAEKENKRLIELRDYLIKKIQDEISDTRLNGHPEDRLPNNVNISFDRVEGEAVLLSLDKEGICVSTGSACSSESLEPSHVIGACSLDEEGEEDTMAHGSVRFTLGKSTNKEDLDFTVQILKKVIEKLRSISPV